MMAWQRYQEDSQCLGIEEVVMVEETAEKLGSNRTLFSFSWYCPEEQNEILHNDDVPGDNRSREISCHVAGMFQSHLIGLEDM